ncbi:MAG: helix-turn-helix domain-containing protein, partial [Pseudomonadota bacterium]
AFDDFRTRYPSVTLDEDAIYVKDGHIYSSAGATSGMDLTIALIEEDFGTEFARRVAQGLVMFLRRPAFQSQFSVHVTTELPDDDRIRRVMNHIAANLHADLRINTLAEQFNFSPRTFIRSFTKTVGTPPGRYIEQCRLDRARTLLEDTDQSLAKISAACGYASTDGLRVAFERNLGASPRQYRARFTSAPLINQRTNASSHG